MKRLTLTTAFLITSTLVAQAHATTRDEIETIARSLCTLIQESITLISNFTDKSNKPSILSVQLCAKLDILSAVLCDVEKKISTITNQQSSEYKSLLIARTIGNEVMPHLTKFCNVLKNHKKYTTNTTAFIQEVRPIKDKLLTVASLSHLLTQVTELIELLKTLAIDPTIIDKLALAKEQIEQKREDIKKEAKKEPLEKMKEDMAFLKLVGEFLRRG